MLIERIIREEGVGWKKQWKRVDVNILIGVTRFQVEAKVIYMPLEQNMITVFLAMPDLRFQLWKLYL